MTVLNFPVLNVKYRLTSMSKFIVFYFKERVMAKPVLTGKDKVIDLTIRKS